MAKTVRMKAQDKGDYTEVKALLKHAMESGLRKDSKTGEKIPAHYIQEVVWKHNGTTVMTSDWSGGVSRDPLVMIRFKGAVAGDEIEIAWTDNQGGSGSGKGKVKAKK